MYCVRRLVSLVNGLLAAAWLMAAMAAAPVAAAEPAVAPTGALAPVQADVPLGVIQLDETVISGNQELPKVLYIVPWQQPDGLPEIELEADFTEALLFRRLYPPAHRRELGYLEAWNANRDQQPSAAKANGTEE